MRVLGRQNVSSRTFRLHNYSHGSHLTLRVTNDLSSLCGTQLNSEKPAAVTTVDCRRVRIPRPAAPGSQRLSGRASRRIERAPEARRERSSSSLNEIYLGSRDTYGLAASPGNLQGGEDEEGSYGGRYGGLLSWCDRLGRPRGEPLRGRVEGEGHGWTPVRNHAVEWRRSEGLTRRRDDRHLEGGRRFSGDRLGYRVDNEDNEG